MPKRTYQDIWTAYSEGPENEVDKYITELESHNTPEADATIFLIRSGNAINRGIADEAIEFAEKAAHMYERIGDASFQSRSLSFIGITYYYNGRVAEAYEQWVRAFALIEDLDLPGQKATFDLNFGNVYRSAGDTSRAMESYRSAIDRFESAGILAGAAGAYSSIGGVYQDTGLVQESIEPLTKAIELHKKGGDINRSGNAYMNLAISYALLGMIEESKKIHDQITESHRVNTIVSLGYDYCKGLHLEHANDIEAAIKVYDSVQKESNKRGYREVEIYALEKLRDCALKQNDLPRYVEFNQRHQELVTKTRGSEVAMRVATHSVEQEVQKERIAREKERALLYGALPELVANRMLRGEDVSGDHYDSASVIFLDIAGFTKIADRIPPGHVVHLLEQIFSTLDEVVEKHHVTKIKTIGDSYMAVAFPQSTESTVNSLHAVNAANCAIEMLSTLDSMELSMPPNLGDTSWTKDVGELQVRIGIHNGPITAGVIGTKRLQYDVWGDTVNVASRMESSGEAGKIHVSEAFAESLSKDSMPGNDDTRHDSHGSERLDPVPVTKRGTIDIKGKGPMTTYWLASS